MLALLEPANLIGFDDRPHLGCAMLIAACQDKQIKTNLIKGQTRYLRDMFINDSGEIWRIIQELQEDSIKTAGIADYRNSILENGITYYQDELKYLYHNIIIDKTARNYFNAHAIYNFRNHFNAIVALYSYYLNELKYIKLSIINNYIDEINKIKPHYIGFSLQSTFDPFSRIIRKRIKEITGLPIIVGGSFTPFIDLKKLDKYFSEEYFDYLVVGTGEKALPALIEALETNKEPEGISNVFYNKNGTIRCNGLEMVRNLDSLPYPDYTQFDLELFLAPNTILPLQTARGCSWKKCTFCAHHKLYLENYVSFSVERVIDIIQYLNKKHNCSQFVFHDDELPHRRARLISEAIVSNSIKNISIYTYARMTKGYNNERLLSFIRNAGFLTIVWGMESGCQRILDLMHKGTNLTDMSQILKKSFANNISNICFIMFGFPGETREEALQTLDFLRKHADYIKENLMDHFYLEPSSPMGLNPGRWGLDINEDGSYSMKSGMNPGDVKAFIHKVKNEIQMNTIKLSNDELNYLIPGHNRRMLHFLVASHELIPNKTLITMLNNKNLNNIFPVILGEIKNIAGETEFWPININETVFINGIVCEKYGVLNEWEEKLFILSDGALSIEDIMLTLQNDYNFKGRKSIQKKCIDFFLDIFSKKYGLGFAKSWRSYQNETRDQDGN